MNPPKIFISATSGDLRGARQIAKEALLTINCHPVEQTNFEPDWRSVTDMLRGKISDCQALIHLVGFCYGAEPDPATLPPGTPRRSYTQMEYHLARELGLRVYTFLLPETYPFDVPAKADTPEQTQLQAAHRALIQSSPHLYEKPANDLDLRARIIALQEQVISLEQEQRSIAKEVKTTRHSGLRAVAAILFILAGIGWGIHHIASQNMGVSAAIAKVQNDVTEVKAVFTKERKFMSLILARANDRLKEWENMKPNERFDLALDQIAAEQKIPSKELRDLLDLYTERVESDPDAEFEDKYNVLMRKQAFSHAAQLANNDGQAAETRMQQQASRKRAAEVIQKAASEAEEIERKHAIESYQKEGRAHGAAGMYEKALIAFERAASLSDRDKDPTGWADAQEWVARILHELARYPEEEPIIRAILAIRKKWPSADDRDVAIALNNLAQLLKETNRLDEAESLMREALTIEESKLGPDDPSVAIALNNLANLLLGTNRSGEAEPLLRRALKINESNFEPEDRNIAISLNNLAGLLNETGRLAEAEPMMRRALEINEKRLGRDHPVVAISLTNLAQLLANTDRSAEAEPLMRRSLTIFEIRYGKNHPYVSTALASLAMVYWDSNRIVDAELALERALKIDEDVLGPHNSKIAFDLMNLAALFRDTNRLEKAEVLLSRAVEILLSFYKSTQNPHSKSWAVVASYIKVARQMKIPDSETHARMRGLCNKTGLSPESFEVIWQKALSVMPEDARQVVITEVVKGGQGEALGLQAGDVYVSYDGQVITSAEQIVRLTGESRGEEIPLEVLREGKKLTFIAKPGKLSARVENRPLPPANGAAPAK